MKTKPGRKPKTTPEVFTVGPEPASDPAPTFEDQTKDRRETVSISFYVNEDGSPDFSSMRDRTREKVKQFFTDPKIAQEFGAKPAVAEVQVFSPAMISGMYDLVGALEAMIFGRAFKLPEPTAKRVFTYTEVEKRALEGPTCRVMNKYAASWMIKFQDEIALATLLVSLTIAKCNAAAMLAKMGNVTTMPGPVSQPEKEETPEKTAADSAGPVQ